MSSTFQDPVLLVITGPTASGKTEAAILAARCFNTQVVSFDSRQFYREMSIGTAVPSEAQLQSVSHHFIQHISIHQAYNVSQFHDDARTILGELFTTHRVVVAVGGSGLYLQALTEGLDELPDIDPELRHALQARLAGEGLGPILEELRLLDPIIVERIDRNNPRRVMRALEVCLQSGRPYSSYLGNRTRQPGFSVVYLVLELPRKTLYERINARVLRMMEEGLEEEAFGLYPHRHLNALNTVGYKELFAYFDGNLTREEAVAEIQKNTRRFAKRQTTWFGKHPEWERIAPQDVSLRLSAFPFSTTA
ncbi:MAG: tRNA (adenosine(37)-N6)-dimethylallyltransferase MiaA [Bacteroidales bacterium]|nr:tRNA (adenosine(37)-N6)-dimethylallyltransferase MiaA [Bacteroidales bacterium]